MSVQPEHLKAGEFILDELSPLTRLILPVFCGYPLDKLDVTPADVSGFMQAAFPRDASQPGTISNQQLPGMRKDILKRIQHGRIAAEQVRTAMTPAARTAPEIRRPTWNPPC
jgi:hypothetical protein